MKRYLIQMIKLYVNLEVGVIMKEKNGGHQHLQTEMEGAPFANVKKATSNADLGVQNGSAKIHSVPTCVADSAQVSVLICN